jgi:hypothetical protein
MYNAPTVGNGLGGLPRRVAVNISPILEFVSSTAFSVPDSGTATQTISGLADNGVVAVQIIPSNASNISSTSCFPSLMFYGPGLPSVEYGVVGYVNSPQPQLVTLAQTNVVTITGNVSPGNMNFTLRLYKVKNFKTISLTKVAAANTKIKLNFSQGQNYCFICPTGTSGSGRAFGTLPQFMEGFPMTVTTLAPNSDTLGSATFDGKNLSLSTADPLLVFNLA